MLCPRGIIPRGRPTFIREPLITTTHRVASTMGTHPVGVATITRLAITTHRGAESDSVRQTSETGPGETVLCPAQSASWGIVSGTPSPAPHLLSSPLPISISPHQEGQNMFRLQFATILTLAIGVALPAGSFAAEKPAAKTGESHDQHFWNCADTCHNCARMCEACSTHCSQLLAEGKKDHLEPLQTCRDCASICTAAASVTSRVGPFSEIICKSCAESCKRCGDTCAKHKDNPMIVRCAEACFKCEKACNEMLKHVSADR